MALNAEGAVDYEKMKTSILKWYDINKETYQRRFQMTKKKEGEQFGKMAMRLND